MPPLLVLLRRHQWQLTRHSIACDTAVAKQRQIRTIVSILSIVSIINDFSTKIPQWATAIAVDYTSCRLWREIFLTQVAMRYPNPCGAVISVRKITERQCIWNLFKWTRTRTCSQRNSDSNLQSAELGLEPAVSGTQTRICSQWNTDSNMQSAKLGLEPAVRGTRTLTCSQRNSDSNLQSAEPSSKSTGMNVTDTLAEWSANYLQTEHFFSHSDKRVMHLLKKICC